MKNKTNQQDYHHIHHQNDKDQTKLETDGFLPDCQASAHETTLKLYENLSDTRF